MDATVKMETNAVTTRTSPLPQQQDGKRFQLVPDLCTAIVVGDARAHLDTQARFDMVYSRGEWGGRLTDVQGYYNNAKWPPKRRIPASGYGSLLGSETQTSLAILRRVISTFNITSMVDIPAGDGNWIFDSLETDHLPVYIGLDVVPSVMQVSQVRFEHHTNKVFRPWDGTQCALPKFRYGNRNDNASSTMQLQTAQLVHSRDVLQHLPFDLAVQFTCNVLQSGAQFWVTTSYPSETVNQGITVPGDFYHNNLFIPPFDLPYQATMECTPTHPHHEPDNTCVFDLRQPQAADWLEPWIASHCQGNNNNNDRAATTAAAVPAAV